MKKELYGLKQSLKAWYSIIDTYLVQQSFIKSVNETTLHIKIEDHSIQLILSLYVNRILTENDSQIMKSFKSTIEEIFEMLDLRQMHYFLDLKLY